MLSLSGLVLAIGFVFDAGLEIFLVRTQLYIYSQVIPFGSFAAGEPHQFPLIWESVFVTTVMIPAGVLLYRDDTGRTQAEKLAQKLRYLRTRPALGTFAVMFVIINAAYLFLYGGGFGIIRATGTATSVACPYPYPEAKVYDPNGYYEKAGQPGAVLPGHLVDLAERSARWPSRGRTARRRRPLCAGRVTDARTVVVTGASRGLGLATAAHLHRAGWTVVAAMRSPDEGMERLRSAGAGRGDERLIAVRLDLDDPESIAAAASSILERVGAPYGIVHNAGVAGVGSLEEMPLPVWEQIFSTNFFGPVRLTKELLPAMRSAGRGRIVMVSSMGAVARHARHRRLLSSQGRARAVGGGAVTGDRPLRSWRDRARCRFVQDGHPRADADPRRPGRPVRGHAREPRDVGPQVPPLRPKPEHFAPAVLKALEERRPFTRHGVGIDARFILIGSRVLPARTLQWAVARALRLSRSGASTGSP